MDGTLTALSGRWMHFIRGRRGRARLSGPDDRPRHTTTGLTALGMNRYRLGEKVVEVVEATPETLKLRFV
jgi:hypothetical protein